jgi:hypothetical protein
MTALECWKEQRAELVSTLNEQTEISDVIYAARHAILQTEQNTLASQNDDVLRQQMGILFTMLKNSVNLLSVPVASTAWAAVSRKDEKGKQPGLPLLLCAVGLLIAAFLWSYAKRDLLGWLLPLAALITGASALIINANARRKAAQQPRETLRTTQTVNAEQLVGAIEAQMVMIDRCATDFAYLNKSLRTPAGGSGWQNLDAVSELLETIYAYDDELRQQADAAVQQLLTEMGLEAVDYTAESEKLFTQLPSKTMTRTLCPALLSAEDHRLLRRGTAVVSRAA